MSQSQQEGALRLQLQPLLSSRTEWLKTCTDGSARNVLFAHRPSGVCASSVGGVGTSRTSQSHIELVEKAHVHSIGIIWPWNRWYRIWWYITALGAVLTVFLAPYQIAFEDRAYNPREGRTMRTMGMVLETVLTFLFTVDILVNFNLAYYKDEMLQFTRRQIAREYFRYMFWVDFVGVFPFQTAAHFFAVNDDLKSSNDTTAYLMMSLWGIFRFARLHRVKKLSDELQNNSRVSLLSFTLLRNFAVVVISCHIQACCMYFLAHLSDFDDNTWLGPVHHDNETELGQYVTSLYWSITTFSTVGYGDFSPVNPAEKILGSFFMLLNILVASWIIGSITLLLLKGDEKTREYRDSLDILHRYGSMHEFDQPLMDTLKEQLRLDFNNRETADEQVLSHFPSAVRRKILRRLYNEHLVNTKLMSGVRPQFVDAFLTSCTVEIFSPGEEIVERGCILSDLFLLVGGIAQIATTSNDLEGGVLFNNPPPSHVPKLEAGDFIGEVGFFTESPQVDSVISLTVCKTLTMSRSTYKLLAHDHPGSIGKILHNLMAKVESTSMQCKLPKPIEYLRAGSNYDYDTIPETKSLLRSRHESLTAVRELVEMHMRRTLENETTRFVYGASRGDTRIISLMCDQGFDLNNTNYDHRTALMVASMKGNTDAVKMLLQYKACPNKTDMHGASALLEATNNGHKDIMDLLLQYKANLCISESKAASILCQAVIVGDIPLLKRLLKAGIDVNAQNYDKRTAAHIAAAEGNLAAIRILAEQGADFALPDRWGNSVEDEARRSNAHQLVAFLDKFKKK